MNSNLPGQKFVAYYRVSTAKQGASGLGLEAQQATVRKHLNGGDWTIVEEIVEVESGKRSDNRPKLAEALRLCRVHGATLIIAKLDRLARNVNFISNLMNSNVEFMALDLPKANRLTIHMMAAIAEHEAELISTRTKAALQAAKARGKKLGGNRGNLHLVRHMGVVQSIAVRSAKSDARAADIAPMITEMQGQGLSLRAIARDFTAKGIPTPRGGPWTSVQIARVLAR
jgi:DNA invertase Pin-like site-specific DNA recombinase